MFSSNTSQVSSASNAIPEAVDFDGTNDHLTRADDFIGNTDGKTFTFSAWVYISAYTAGFAPILEAGSKVQIYIDSSVGRLNVYMQNSAGTAVLNAFSQSPTEPAIALNTFNHILVSVDLTNTAKRHLYINDVAMTFSYSTYTNANIDFTNTNYRIAYSTNGPTRLKGRLSNLFLDYTYRDFTVTANRRLFVTSDMKPASGQASLSPIMYLPMSSPSTVATNLGTGGDFALTGSVERSGRGANQYNAPYSDLDGSTQYLSRTTAPSGIADGKQGTFACTFNVDATSLYVITSFSSSTSLKFVVKVGSGEITVEGYDSAGSQVFALSQNAQIKANRNYVLVLSFDTSDANKYHLYVNGVQATTYFTVYTSTNIDYAITTTPRYYIGANPTPSQYFNGRLGAVWFNTSYIDLSVASNLAKFVTGTGIDAKPADLGTNGELPTGTSPIIYLPMYGHYAGKNYGTGGDFTINAGPYTGARGPNEFWGNWADFVPTDYLLKSGALSGVSNGKTFSFSVWVRPDTLTGARTIFCFYNGTALRFELRFAATQFVITARNSANTTILSAGTGTVFATATQYCIQGCIDLSNSSNRKIYVNGALDSTTWTTYTNADINFASSTNEAIGVSYANSSSDEYDGKIGELYWTTNYIDFSQEANRLLFRDCFGNPTDLPSAITAATVPTPAVYMRFNPASFGTNSGTGGNFTVTATPLDGGQF